MTSWKRAGVSLVAFGGIAAVLAGCSTGRVATRNVAQPEQLQPLPSSQVAQANLPAIGESGAVTSGQLPNGSFQTAQIGTPANAGQVNPALTGQPILGGNQPQPVETASADGSFVTLDAVGSVPNSPGRDLSGGLTTTKLIGGWTIVSGAEQCKLFLTETAKAGTTRFRASSPGCQMQGLNVVSSWQLAGSQVQLFDENGDIIATLSLSGNRFVGILSGGRGISMVG